MVLVGLLVVMAIGFVAWTLVGKRIDSKAPQKPTAEVTDRDPELGDAP